MTNTFLQIEQSLPLEGKVSLVGAKNAVLVIMASLLLTTGKSRLSNVPASADVLHMIALLEQLGAEVLFDRSNHELMVDTTNVNKWRVSPEIMQKMRASILAMGPLLARFSRADIALPGGCVIGARPVDYHLKSFAAMGAEINFEGDYLRASTRTTLQAKKIILEYPSVGATENIMMAATLTPGVTTIINAALEPEVMDLMTVLQKMGASITVEPAATIRIQGVKELYPIEHEIVSDRLEAGSLLLAAAVTGGQIELLNARADHLDIFLYKLQEMGHHIVVGPNEYGITFKATQNPNAVSFKTGPYPAFPTDLQAPMMVAQVLAKGTSTVEETVFENRLVHVRELHKMGAQIEVDHNKAIITGVEELYGASVIATDIRASCALVIAGLVAKGVTTMTGVHHWRRGYEALESKLQFLGARVKTITLESEDHSASSSASIGSQQMNQLNH